MIDTGTIAAIVGLAGGTVVYFFAKWIDKCLKNEKKNTVEEPK